MNTAAASSVSVAEMAMAFMVAIPARLIEAHMAMKEGKFPKNELKRTELFKKTLGLIGAGAIATEVAKRAQGFGMKVIAYDPFLTTHAVAELKTLDEVLAQSDVITIHTPLTDQTRGMFNKDAFAKMKDGVMIINTARGKVIAEADLAEALKSGKVRAYGTDVWFSDPPPADCPLLTAPNVFMAPHIGGSSKENLLRIGDTVVEILSRFKV
jgi:D-3-phosphoglycerate dehydrogenase